MRILLTSNASYVPPRGGATRSNLLWLEHMAAAGHASGSDPHINIAIAWLMENQGADGNWSAFVAPDLARGGTSQERRHGVKVDGLGQAQFAAQRLENPVGLANHDEINESIRRPDTFLPDGDAHRAARDLRANRAHNLGLQCPRNIPIATAHLDVAAPAVERTDLDDQPSHTGRGCPTAEPGHTQQAGAHGADLPWRNHARVRCSPVGKSTAAV